MSALKDVKRVYSFWGKHPSLYSLVTSLTFLGRESFLRQRTALNLGLRRGGVVLDLACGSGRNFFFLEKVVGEEGKIIGFDYSVEMLKAARNLALKNKWQNIKLVRGDAAELKIEQKDIDGAISVLGLSAIPNFAMAIQRTHDVLKKGSTFSVCDAKPLNGLLTVFNPLIKLLYKKGAVWDWRRDIPKEMKQIFGNVEAETFLNGIFYIAKSIKQ